MRKLEFQCCFCGIAIAHSAVDPCAVVLVGNWSSADPELQAEQQFWCHVACFRQRVARNVPVEIEALVAAHIAEAQGSLH